MSVRSKLENIWYHYKSYIIVSIFLIGTVVFALHSCVTKSEFDIKVYYMAGSTSLYTEQLSWVEEAVGAACGDVNGDGQVKVSVTGLRVGKYADTATVAQYMTAVQAGEVMIFFGDEGGIQYLYNNNYLQPLNEFTSHADGNGYAWKVNGSAFSEKTAGFEMFSDMDLYISLRVFDDTWAASFETGQQTYDVACSFLRTVIGMESDYDLRSYYLSESSAPTDARSAWVRAALASVCPDRNGDGTIRSDLTPLDLSKSSTYDKYLKAVSSENRYLIFGDEKAIATLSSEKVLVSLSEYSDALDPTGCGWRVNGSDFASSVAGFDAFGEDKLYVALRALGENPSEQQRAMYENAQGILMKLMSVGKTEE